MIYFFFIFHLQTNKRGCAIFSFMMSHFTKLDNKAVKDQLTITVNMEEEGTGQVSNQKEIYIKN